MIGCIKVWIAIGGFLRLADCLDIMDVVFHLRRGRIIIR